MYFQKPFFFSNKKVIFNQEISLSNDIDQISKSYLIGIFYTFEMDWKKIAHSFVRISNYLHYNMVALYTNRPKNDFDSEYSVECARPFGLFYALFRLCCGFLYDNVICTIYIYIPFCTVYFAHPQFSIRFDFIFQLCVQFVLSIFLDKLLQ